MLAALVILGSAHVIAYTIAVCVNELVLLRPLSEFHIGLVVTDTISIFVYKACLQAVILAMLTAVPGHVTALIIAHTVAVGINKSRCGGVIGDILSKGVSRPENKNAQYK
jgi:hypothetical protein